VSFEETGGASAPTGIYFTAVLWSNDYKMIPN